MRAGIKGWRYQPVIMDNDGAYLLCEVSIAADDTLNSWTEAGIYPCGDGAEALRDLTQDICRMLVDAYSWVPVKESELRVGMKFERALTMAQREALGEFVANVAHNARETAG